MALGKGGRCQRARIKWNQRIELNTCWYKKICFKPGGNLSFFGKRTSKRNKDRKQKEKYLEEVRGESMEKAARKIRFQEVEGGTVARVRQMAHPFLQANRNT